MKTHWKKVLLSCVVLPLLGNPALANHCAGDLAAVQARLSQPTQAGSSALEAAAELVQSAIAACDYEEAVIAEAPEGAPIREPGYVTVGRSMLINSLQLVDVR